MNAEMLKVNFMLLLEQKEMCIKFDMSSSSKFIKVDLNGEVILSKKEKFPHLQVFLKIRS